MSDPLYSIISEVIGEKPGYEGLPNHELALEIADRIRQEEDLALSKISRLRDIYHEEFKNEKDEGWRKLVYRVVSWDLEDVLAGREVIE